jgi:hypothetical protein
MKTPSNIAAYWWPPFLPTKLAAEQNSQRRGGGRVPSGERGTSENDDRAESGYRLQEDARTVRALTEIVSPGDAAYD